jgi:hypothetical protein
VKVVQVRLPQSKSFQQEYSDEARNNQSLVTAGEIGTPDNPDTDIRSIKQIWVVTVDWI